MQRTRRGAEIRANAGRHPLWEPLMGPFLALAAVVAALAVFDIVAAPLGADSRPDFADR